MKRVACKIATLAVLALLPGIAAAQAPKEPTSTSQSMAVWPTRRTVMDAFEYIYIPDSNSGAAFASLRAALNSTP